MLPVTCFVAPCLMLIKRNEFYLETGTLPAVAGLPRAGTARLFQDGLVKTNMEKLTFYALSAPEKLDRIGAYLSERLIRDVGRHRYG